jgi:hypothetical protein
MTDGGEDVLSDAEARAGRELGERAAKLRQHRLAPGALDDYAAFL